MGEERFAHGDFGLTAKALQDFDIVEFAGKDGGPDLIGDAAATEGIGSVKFGDWHFEGDRQDFFGVDDDAHVVATATPLFARAVDVPTAAHKHVGEKNQVAGEINEGPFADGFYFFDSATSDGRVYFDAFEFGKNAFEAGDGLAGEGAMESARGTKNCVAFGHLAGLREIVVRVGVVGGIFCIAAGNHGGESTHLEAHGGVDEASFFEEGREKMFARGSVVDFADEQAGAATLAADGEFR